jgi:hypothetical protein
MTAAGVRFAEARARLGQDVTRYAAAVLAAETRCPVRPVPGLPGRFEVRFPCGLLIGTAAEIHAWQETLPGQREALLREWLAVLGTQGRSAAASPEDPGTGGRHPRSPSRAAERRHVTGAEEPEKDPAHQHQWVADRTDGDTVYQSCACGATKSFRWAT